MQLEYLYYSINEKVQVPLNQDIASVLLLMELDSFFRLN